MIFLAFAHVSFAATIIGPGTTGHHLKTVSGLDWFHQPSYELLFEHSDALQPDSIRMATTKDVFQCIVPPAEAKLGLPMAEDSLEYQRALIKRSQALLKDFPCLYHVNGGYWTYEICRSKGVRQFYYSHDGQKPQSGPTEFILGRASLVSQRVVRKTTDDSILAYYVEEFDGGAKCDLTGEPRRTSVEYHCAASEFVSVFREVSTCNYQAIIHTPRLCREEAFRKNDAIHSSAIRCLLQLSPNRISASDAPQSAIATLLSSHSSVSLPDLLKPPAKSKKTVKNKVLDSVLMESVVEVAKILGLDEQEAVAAVQDMRVIDLSDTPNIMATESEEESGESVNEEVEIERAE